LKSQFLLVIAFSTLIHVAYAQSAQQSSRPAIESQPELADISTDRPGFSTSTGIVPRGHFQLEAGAAASRSGDDRSYSFGQLLVRVPVSDRAEARVGVPSYLVSRSGGARSTGFDNVFVEGKYLLSTQKRVAYALLVNAVLPTGSRKVTTREFQPGANFAADVTLTDKIGATFNLGVVRGADPTATTTRHPNELFGAASFNFALSKKTGAFTELYAIGGDGQTQKYLDGGFTFLLSPRTQLDASAGVGLGNGASGPDYFYGVGVSRLF